MFKGKIAHRSCCVEEEGRGACIKIYSAPYSLTMLHSSHTSKTWIGPYKRVNDRHNIETTNTGTTRYEEGRISITTYILELYSF